MTESLYIRKLFAQGRFEEAEALLNDDDDDDDYGREQEEGEEPDDEKLIRFLDGEIGGEA